MSYPASERRFLPAVPTGFELGDREELSHGLRRLTVEQFDGAMKALASDDAGAATHEVRKATKRLRAVLRLVRPTLGDKRYRAENAQLRDTARLIAPIRDADVALGAVVAVQDRFAAQLRPTAFAGLADRLERQRQLVLAGAPTSEEWRRVAYALRSARARYAAWPVDRESARAHGMKMISHAFPSVGDGLASIYSRGRQEMGQAVRRPTAENFHQWRKRAKYLRHQIEILTPIWPDMLEGYAASLDRLGELLGDDHDFVELLRLVARRPELCPDPVERSLLVALVQHRRMELQSAALSLGARIYAEPTPRFTDRLADYWKAWDAPVPVGFGD